MIIDTHIHLCDAMYDADRGEMLKRAKNAGVNKLINVGADMDENRRICEFSEVCTDGIYASIGLHPHYAGEFNDAVYREIKELADRCKCIKAVGEIGLDYYKNETPKEIQAGVFEHMLLLAKEKNLPVAIHSREAYDDAYAILKQHGPGKKGVLHCFGMDYDTAKKYIDLGYALGIGGVVTFKNAPVLKDAVRKIPLEHIVLETDAPYLAPQAHRGKRNEPSYLQYVVAEIAALKNIMPQEVERVTTENAERLFII